ncbi:hypothetical protein VU06_02435, partial [Desulfobulbus sp. F3]|nr:hypothetical protein [Desulfobulbus sp. F3]
EALLEHVMKNPSAALEERVLFFSVKHQSVYARMKDPGMTRKKRLFSAKKETNGKGMNFSRRQKLRKKVNTPPA